MQNPECNCACASTTKQSGNSEKRWNIEFSQKHDKNSTLKEPLFIDTLQNIDVQRELQDAFLQYTSEFAGSSWEVEKVKKFFREAGTVPDAKVWIDFCMKDAKPGKIQSNWIDSSELVHVLDLQRSESAESLLHSRRLSFMPYATPTVIEDFIKTATAGEIDALRPAVCQYFGGKTLMRVHTSIEGYPVFRLILNLPCLSLENSSDSTSDTRLLDDHNKKLWENLSYLPLESSTGKESNQFAIYETRTTIVISGCNDSQWFGYALGNIGPVDPSPEDHENVPDEKSEEENDPEPEEDLFATGGCERVLNPDSTIRDPRVYFLRATQIRMSVACQASEYLVSKLDAGCQSWIPQLQDYESNQKALVRIIGMTKVFQRLREHYAQAIRAWTRFSGTGDAQYFSDLRTNSVARDALSSIEKSFENFFDLERRLIQLEKNCKDLSDILQLQIAQENNRMTQETNQLTLENMILTRTMTEINLTTSSHSESAAESAAKSSTAAEETSRATRVNVQLFVLTTALVIALQYFCSDRALFAFERTPRAFWISIGVLMPSLALVSWLLDAVDHLKTVLTRRLNGEIEKVVTPASTAQMPSP